MVYSRFLFLALSFGLFTSSLPAEDWPQWLGPKGDSVWRESGIAQKFPAGGPRILWRTSIGAGYAGPAVAKGKVYVMDRQLSAGANNPADPFQRGIINGSERVVCLDERSGKILWKFEYDCPYTVSYPDGPRATALVSEGKVYSVGAEGNLSCLDAKTGKLVWSRDFKKDFNAKTPMWGFAGHPLLDGKKLICLAGGEGALVVALDKNSGKELWRALDAKEPGYSSPIIFKSGKRHDLIIWNPESVNGLDPETGKKRWSVPVAARAGMSIATPRQFGDQLLVTSFYNGSLMLRLTAEKTEPQVSWRTEKASEKNTTHLNAVMSTP